MIFSVLKEGRLLSGYYRSAWIWSWARQRVRHNCKAGHPPWAGIVCNIDRAAENYTRKSQRQSHRAYEPRRTRRVLPRFLFGCQTSDRSHELQNLTCEISPCVAQIKRTQTNPKSLNNPHTADLSRFVDAKRHKLRVHRDSWLVPLLLIIRVSWKSRPSTILALYCKWSKTKV